MELTQEKRDLVEKLVKSNRRFSGNEDLLDDFCNEAFKRSFSVASKIDDPAKLEIYIKKIISSSIIEVLRTFGRLKRTTEGYKRVNEAYTATYISHSSNDKSSLELDIPDPAPHFEERMLQKAELEEIRKILFQIASENQNKSYMELFKLRYLKGLKQSEISAQTGLSQSEVSKRLSELISEINKRFDKK